MGALLALVLTASTASAQATRTWVSGVGDDANPCSRTAPCKTFAGAISKTAAGGEIDCLDPGGMGAVTITKSITIDGGAALGRISSSGTNGVIINAASTDTVVLRNLEINGYGTGLNGIRILNAGAVHVENCVISNCTQKGIDCQNTSGMKLLINDTIVRNNTNSVNGGALAVKPAAGIGCQVFLNRVQFDKNTFGLRVEDNVTVSAKDSSFSSSHAHGIIATPTSDPAFIDLDNCVVSKNVSSGLRSVGAAATIRYADCLIDHNNKGLDAVNNGKLLTFGNNKVVGNTTAGAPTGSVALE